MASLKAEKTVGTQLFGQAKKKPANTKTAGDGSKTATAKTASKKAAQKPQEPKKKGKSRKIRKALKDTAAVIKTVRIKMFNETVRRSLDQEDKRKKSEDIN